MLPQPPPAGDLRSQQREVVTLDGVVGDTFYDERATVDPTIAKPPAAPPAPATTTPGAMPGVGPRPMLPQPPPTGDLRSQQREVVTLDGVVGDTFYDQRATVDPTIAKPPAAPPAPATTPPGTAASTAGVAAAEQAANAAVNTVDPAADEAKTKAQTEAELAHEAMHATAGTAGGAIDKTQAAAVAAQQKTAAEAKDADAVVGMIDPDLKKVPKPGQVPLDAINPDLKGKQPAKPGDDVPLDAIDPDLKKGKPPGKRGAPPDGDIPLDARNPDLQKRPTKDGDVPLDAIDPDLKKGKKLGDELLNPYADEEAEPLFDLNEFEAFPGGDELKKAGQGVDPDAKVDPSLDGKVADAKANPQATKEILKGVQADAAVKKGVIKQGVDTKAAAVGKAQAKGVAGAAAKGGKKVATVAGKGAAKADAAKGKVAEKKIEKAKNIEELKQRLKTAFDEEKKKLTDKIAEQKKDLEKKIADEQKKIDDEMKAQADKLAKELAAKNQDIDKQIAEKKKAYDKQIADDKKKAEKTCKDEQKKTQDTTNKEVAKIQKQGDSEAQKVTQQGHKDAAAARQRGNAKANAAVNGANQKAAGIEDAAAKQSAKDAGQRAANSARAAANAEAKQIEDAAKAEASKRKELTKKLVEETKEKGKLAIAALDTKLQQSLADIAKKATDGTAAMEAERKKMVAEVKELETKLKTESAKKNEEAKFKIHTLKLDSEKRIKDMETNGLKGIQTKNDEMLVKLEKGNAADLAKLEEETNKIVGDIKMSVAGTTAAIDKEIKLAQDKAAHEAKKRVDAIQADGKTQLDALDKKVKDVQAKIEEIDAATKAGLKKAGEDAKKGLEEKGQQDRDALVAGADKAVGELAKTSEQYEADKKAEEEAARKKQEEEERKKKEEEQAKLDAEKKKEEEKKAEEEKKKAEFEAKTKGAADQLFKAMDGWGTDEKAIMNALKGKSPEEMKAIKEAYQKKTGRSLDADLADEMSGTDLKEAKALMSADPVQGAVAQLQSAMEGWGTDEKKVKETLDSITDPEVKKKVIAEYEKQTGQRLQKALEEEGITAADGVKVDDYAKEKPPEETGPQRELSDDEKKAANTAVTELEGAMHRWGTDEAAVFNALKGKSPEQIKMMKDAYYERHKPKTLDDILEDELSGTDLKEAKALMSADPVQAAVAQLHNAADGLGTDDEKIIATLKDIKDPEVRKKVAAEYEKQTGDKLDAMLEDEMSGMDKDLAKALKGDESGNVKQGEVAAIEADKAMHGGFLTDISDSIADTVGADRETMRSVTGGVVTAVVLGPLAGPVLAFGGGAVIGTDVGGTDEEALYKALESCETPEQREELKREYAKRYPGRTLEGDLKGELTAKEQDVTNALLVGDKTTAEAAKMAAAADGLGTDRKALYASLEGKSKEEREAIIAKFNEKYAADWPKKVDPKTGKEMSPFEAMCDDELDELDKKKAAMIAENGKMNDGFAAYYAMNEGFLGIGTDDDLLKSRLQGKSKEEVLQIQKEYLRAKCEAEGKPVPPDLDKMTADNPALQALNNDIAGETSGRTGHQLKQALKGNPTTPEEALERAKEDRDFERKESGWIGEVGMAVLLGPGGYVAAKAMGVSPADISNGLTDMWSDSGKQLEWDVAKLEADIAASKAKHASDPSLQGLSEEERKKKLDELVMADLKGSGQLDFVAGSQKQYEEAKDATADAAGTAVAIAVGAIITIASGGTAAPALVALISGLAGVSAKMIISGASMSNEQLVQELAQVAAEALAAGLVNTKWLNTAIENVAGKFGKGLAAKIIKEALEEAVESGTEELILALLDENLYKGDLVDFANGIGGRVGKAVLTGAGAAVVSTGFGDLMPGMNKLAGSGIHGKAAAGAINQAVGAAFTTAIDPNTYSGSGADVAMAFGKSMGSAALRGLQDGYSTGEGFKSGDGWKSGPSQKVDTRSSSPDAATATTQTTGTTTSAKGDTAIDAKTEVDVKKGDTSVQVDAKGTTTVSGPDGTTTATDSTSKTIPLDNNATNDNTAVVDPTQQTDKKTESDKKTETDQKTDGDSKTNTNTTTDTNVDTSVDNKQVPQDKADLRAFVAAKYAAIVSKYQGIEHSADPRYGDLITELKKYAPGELGKPENKAAAKAILDQWMALSEQISKETGKSEGELRELYNMVEKQDMPIWLEQMKGLSPKQQAEMLHMFRTELKVMIRDLMTDTNSKEVLYLRDLAVYGDRNGPLFADLMAKAMKKNGGNEEAAYKSIVESAQRSNSDVNKGITGNESGLKGPTPATGLQSSNDLATLYAQAAEADPILKSITSAIASETGGQPMFPPGLKGKERAMEKIAGEYGGDASRIVDLSRASIVYDSFDALKAGLAALEGKVEIVKTKDRFDKPTASGYRDITLNVKINGHVCELQLHLKQIMEVKQGKGHELYEKSRAIEAKAQIEGRDLTADEAAQIKAIESEAKALYDAAFDSAMNPSQKAEADKKPKPPATGLQSSNDLDTLYQQAAEADPILKSITSAIAAETGGEPMFPPGLKGKPRAMEKIAGEYGGDASRIVDLSRASIVYDSVDALKAGLAALQGKVEIVKTKDRFDKPTASGYRDITLNVKINGHVCELQLHLKQIMEVKQGKGHELYEQSRAIEAKAQIEGRDLTAEEAAQIKAIEAEAKKLYDAAFDSATKTESSGESQVTGPESITAAAIPGSTFKGKTDRAPDAAGNITTGEAKLQALAAQFGLTDGKKGKADRDGRYSYEFKDADGKPVTIRIASVPLSGNEVARSIVNPTKDAHVIQISDKADPDHIERAVAHELAEIMAIRERAAKGKPTRVDDDALAKGAHEEGAELSPHDMGRLAELDVLARQLAAAKAAGDAAKVQALTREVHALIEHLGLREGTQGAKDRRKLVDGAATDAAKQLLAEKAKMRTELQDAAEQQMVLDIRKAAKKDAKSDQAEEHYNRPLRDQEFVSKVDGKSEADMAKEAAEARQKKSDEVVARLRAEAATLPEGKFPKVKDPQIGGGAAVAALTPGQLFVDARGRWQKDASSHIAQTAHQLGGIKQSGIGDPSQFAKSGDRVSLDAINFMQDSIAAQADVINGTANMTLDDQGRMILTIQPLDADGKPSGAPIKLEIEGTPVVASGFPPENVPRGRQSMAENRAALIAGLQGLGTAEGNAAAAKLKATPTQDDAGFGAILDGLPLDQKARLLGGDAKLKAAITAVEATKLFMAEKAKNPSRVVLGQDANLTDLMKDKAAFEAVEHWVIAGVGGTSISAAEIILKANPNAKVTMIGGSITPGLGDNDQFKRVMAEHGPGGTKTQNFQVVTGQDIPSIETDNDGETYKAGGQLKAKVFVKADTDLDSIKPGDHQQWLVDASDPTMLAKVEKILTGNPDAKVTIVGAALATDDVSKAKLRELVGVHGPTGRGKLEVVTGDNAAVESDGAGGFQTKGKVEGDGYVASLGFRGNISPTAQQLIDQADAKGWRKGGELLFDKDGQYLGYRVTVQTPSGPKSLDVTGGASRAVPDFILKGTDAKTGRPNAELLAEASDRDAPPEGGNFDGGYVASAAQAARYARDKRARQEADQNTADEFELHGNKKKLSLDSTQPDTWAGIVQKFLAAEMGVEPGHLTVKKLGGGASGAMVFKVKVGDADVGVFKVFKDMQEARTEIAMIKLMASKELKKFNVVDNKSTSALRVGDPTKPGAQNKGAMLMGTASGREVSSQIENLSEDADTRAASLAQMESDCRQIAEALAEFHQAFASGEMMSPEAKAKAAKYIIDRKIEPHMADFGADGPAIMAKMLELIERFKAAPVPATAYHGDANAGNFMVDGDQVNVIDVGAMQYSLKDGKGVDTGAADLARFEQSLETLHPGKLTPAEVKRLREAFEAAYFAATKISPADLEAARIMYAVEVEIAVMRANPKKYDTPTSIARIKALLGI